VTAVADANDTGDRVQVADTGVSLPLATGWMVLPASPAQLTLAVAGWEESWGFRPNLNVLVADSAEAPDVQELAALAVSAVVSSVESVHVLAYEIHEGPAGIEGRRATFAYPQGDIAVTTSQWVFAYGTSSCTVTASCRVDQLTTYAAPFDGLVAGIRLPAEGG
jgi:hypothetical protein